MTLTIIARNPYTRQLGVAIASGSDDCVGGSLEIMPDFGVVSVQAKGDKNTRARACALLAEGVDTQEILQILRSEDTSLDLRQVLLAPMDGDCRVFTGLHCLPWAGDLRRDHLLLAGNMLSSDKTLEVMEQAYLKDMHAPMRRRLFAALAAGIAQGGDVRGHRSAGIIVTGHQPLELVVTKSLQPLEQIREAI